jgi:hypothetical protein
MIHISLQLLQLLELEIKLSVKLIYYLLYNCIDASYYYTVLFHFFILLV